MEQLKITFKDVNNQKIEYTGKKKTTVKTIKETIELPLLKTKAQTSSV